MKENFIKAIITVIGSWLSAVLGILYIPVLLMVACNVIDYITGISKYKGQFSNQYAVKLEVLKIEHDTTKLNGAWNESLVKDVKAGEISFKDVK